MKWFITADLSEEYDDSLGTYAGLGPQAPVGRASA